MAPGFLLIYDYAASHATTQSGVYVSRIIGVYLRNQHSFFVRDSYIACSARRLKPATRAEVFAND